MLLDLEVIIILCVGLVISAAVCLMLHSLIKAAIAMAATSAILAVILFALGASLAAVFELSVCAGLIPVIFFSAIHMTGIFSKEEIDEQSRIRRRKFAFLPVILIAAFVVVGVILWPHVDAAIPSLVAGSGLSVQDVLWEKRQADLIGQIVIILAGVYGVIVFFKERDVK